MGEKNEFTYPPCLYQICTIWNSLICIKASKITSIDLTLTLALTNKTRSLHDGAFIWYINYKGILGTGFLTSAKPSLNRISEN